MLFADTSTGWRRRRRFKLKGKLISNPYLADKVQSLGISLTFTVVVWLATDDLFRLLGWPSTEPVPFYFSGVLSIVAGGVSFTASEIMYNYKTFGKKINHLKKLDENLEPIRETPVGDFVEHSILSLVEETARFYSGLIEGGTMMLLNKKMSIANSLHDPNFGARPPREHYWATTIDDPVDMIADQTFFEKQARLPCSSKRRLVVIGAENYYSTMQDSAKLRPLKRFLEWHRANSFSLKFWLESPEAFYEKVRSDVWLASESDVLTDFAVFDGHHVFGATLTKRAQKDEPQRVRLVVQEEVCRQYSVFFDNVWNNGQVLDRSVVEEDCAFEELRVESSARIVEQYSGRFSGAERGKSFFRRLCEITSDARSKILAVDIASIKDEESNLGVWLRPAYLDFVHATAKAATLGADCSRLYIVRGSLPKIKLEALVDVVMRPQVEAGVKLYFLDAARLVNMDHSPRDFILVDDDFGFGLGRKEPFDPESLSMRNLILQEQLDSLEGWAHRWLSEAAVNGNPAGSPEECFEALTALLRRQ